MILLTNITDDPKQTFNLIGENKEQIAFNLYYFPTQNAWFFDISYLDFSLNGVQLCSSINALRQFRNVLPFGLSVVTTDGQDPWFINDFTSGRVTVYLLNSTDVNDIEGAFFT